MSNVIDIDNWHKLADGLVGKVRNHPRQDEFDPENVQWTSPIKNILTDYDDWKEGDLVESHSGHTYRLGKKADVE